MMVCLSSELEDELAEQELLEMQELRFRSTDAEGEPTESLCIFT